MILDPIVQSILRMGANPRALVCVWLIRSACIRSRLCGPPGAPPRARTRRISRSGWAPLPTGRTWYLHYTFIPHHLVKVVRHKNLWPPIWQFNQFAWVEITGIWCNSKESHVCGCFGWIIWWAQLCCPHLSMVSRVLMKRFAHTHNAHGRPICWPTLGWGPRDLKICLGLSVHDFNCHNLLSGDRLLRK